MSAEALHALARQVLDLVAAKGPGGTRVTLNNASVSSRAAIRELEGLGEARLRHLIGALAQIDSLSLAAVGVEFGALLRSLQIRAARDPEPTRKRMMHVAEFADVLGAIAWDRPLLDLSLILDEALSLHEKVQEGAVPQGWVPSLPATDYSTVDRHVRDDAAAFLLAVCLTSEEEDSVYELVPTAKHPPHPGLVALCRRHLHNPQRICSLARNRGTAHPDVLGPLLDPETPALAEGYL